MQKGEKTPDELTAKRNIRLRSVGAHFNCQARKNDAFCKRYLEKSEGS